MIEFQLVLGNIISDIGVALLALILAYVETLPDEEARLSDLKKYSCVLSGIIILIGVVLQVTALLDVKIAG